MRLAYKEAFDILGGDFTGIDLQEGESPAELFQIAYTMACEALKEKAEASEAMTYEEALEYAESYITLKGIPIDSEKATKCIIEALKKQIPKNPIGDLHSVPHHRCPNCNRAIRLFLDDAYDAYCRFCGQRICWSEEE